MGFLSPRIKKIILFDLFLFFIFITIVNSYKLFFLLLAFVLNTFLTYNLVKGFITLTFLCERSNLNESNDANEDFKLKLFRIVFHNEYIYKLIKALSRRNFFKYQMSKIFSTSTNKKIKHKNHSVDCKTSKLDMEVRFFIKKFSFKFIESWYKPLVSDNDQFLNEAQIQLEIIFLDIFRRVKNVDKLSFFANITNLFNNNFLNVGLALSSGQIKQIPLENLHPAALNLSSEVAYYKSVIQIILKKSSPNLKLNNFLIEELFYQIIGKNCLENMVKIVIRPKFIYFSMALLVDKQKTYEKFYSLQTNTNKTEPLMLEEINDEKDTSNMLCSYVITDDINQKRFDEKRDYTIQTDKDFSSIDNFQMENVMPRTFSNISNKISSDNDYEIFNLRIDKTETNNDGKTKYTLYNIEVLQKFILKL